MALCSCFVCSLTEMGVGGGRRRALEGGIYWLNQLLVEMLGIK